MSLLLYGGSSQLAVLPLMAAKLPLWTLLLTAAMVNLRFVIFSAGMAPHFRTSPLPADVAARADRLFQRRRDLPAVHPTRFRERPCARQGSHFWGMALVSWLSWQASSLAGIALASVVPDQWGLGLAGTLALIPIMVSAAANRSTLAAVVVAGIVALLAIDLPYRLGLPLAVLAALAAGTLADTFIERAEVRPCDALDASEAGRDGEGGAR
ncbi:MAG: AzlC family ABC transporter permease [Burkholderia sp.]